MNTERQPESYPFTPVEWKIIPPDMPKIKVRHKPTNIKPKKKKRK